MADFRRLFYALALVALLAGLTVPASAQPAALQCATTTGVPPIIRAEGHTELVGDIILNCTGGTPTLAGQAVAPVNISVSISTNLTSRLLSGGLWSEALLIIDEPHSAVQPGRWILNCGAPGALDNGDSGANVCGIVSNGNPELTYDGTPNAFGTTTCGAGGAGVPAAGSYGCGRPNVWQGRLGSPQNPNQYNSVSWLGVPLDPPGTGTTRTIRITNIRADAHTLGVNASGNFFLNTVQAQITINGNTSLSLSNPQVVVADVENGLAYPQVISTNNNFLQCVGEHYTNATTNVFGSGTTPGTTVFSSTAPGQSTGSNPKFAFTEGFASSWKAKNIAQIITAGGNAGNGVLQSGNTYWTYDGYASGGSGGTLNYPKDLNQNVPGAIYNTESGFEYPVGQSDPNPNPPAGTGITGTVLISSQALQNGTGISGAGVADAGTRLQIQISNIPGGSFVLVPEAILLTNGTSSAPGVAGISGVAVLTNTDAFGAGAYSPVYTGVNNALTAAETFTPLPTSGMAVYEVIFADPFSIESASITAVVAYQPNLSLNNPTPSTTAQVFGGFAPFYSTQSASEPEPLTPGATPTAIPRFAPGLVPSNPNFFSVGKCACNLLFPFVSSQGGYDTGIAIANTSLDNLGNSSFSSSAALSQYGGVQFWYYGIGNNGGSAPPTQCTNPTSPGTCPSPVSSTTPIVSAGQVLTYVLSSGGGSIGTGANGLDNRANGFSGYIIAQAQFQYCHGFGFITAVGAGPLTQAVSEGYLALNLDNSSWNCGSIASSSTAGEKVLGLCRTGQSSENLVH